MMEQLSHSPALIVVALIVVGRLAFYLSRNLR